MVNQKIDSIARAIKCRLIAWQLERIQRQIAVLQLYGFERTIVSDFMSKERELRLELRTTSSHLKPA